MKIYEIIQACRLVATEINPDGSFLNTQIVRESFEGMDKVYPCIVLLPINLRNDSINRKDNFDMQLRFLGLNPFGISESPDGLELLLQDIETLAHLFLIQLKKELVFKVDYRLSPFYFEDSAICSGYQLAFTLIKNEDCGPWGYLGNALQENNGSFIL